ncbi:DUF1573 domain-containing protein [Nitritalea halalkaliphila]|nr:DUF1573 domain-containing protein [Nitritalea halalkaliphila]
MKRKITLFFVFSSALFTLFSGGLLAQEAPERLPLFWEKQVLSLGTFLAEEGPQVLTFYGLNQHDQAIALEEVVSDCACLQVRFARDSVAPSKIAALEVTYTPDYQVGSFMHQLLVKTSADAEGDTLYVQGRLVPLVSNAEEVYRARQGELAFRSLPLNLGRVFTHEPTEYRVDVHNFGKSALMLSEVQPLLPEFLQVRIVGDTVAAASRALLAIAYDGAMRNDLGQFSEQVAVLIRDETGQQDTLRIPYLVTVLEYFEPVPSSMQDIVPRLLLSETAVDLRQVRAGSIVERELEFENVGQEELVLRKVMANCTCLEVEVDEMILAGGQKGRLKLRFDTSGRKGIDHKEIYVFSNDPIRPVQTIRIKSSLQ